MSNKNYIITPTVDPTQEFIEIAYDFSNPLDLVREGISNSFDAGATEIEVSFSVISEYGEKILVTSIKDNGHGMNEVGLQSFFDLGNSTRRNDQNAIGEKGHGTKVYLNSSQIEVITVNNGVRYTAVMDSPIKKLHNNHTPEVNVNTESCDEENGTTIKISGYNNNRRNKFTHENLKDYMPIQRKNEWITQKGSEYTRFHAFFNCQDFRLTANRSSVDNTPTEIIEDIHKVITSIYEEIIQSDDWRTLEWLENEVASYNTVQKEKKDFDWRIKRIESAKIADYKGVRLIEPTQENGVFSIFMQIQALMPDAFPFKIVDYDTHAGIDVIVKDVDSVPIKESKLYYVEFKNYFKKEFNHSFENLHSIVCWDIDPKLTKNGDEISDIAGIKRIMRIVPPKTSEDRTYYFLDDSRSSHKIQVYVLKHYLEEVLGITFKARTEKDSF